jgi:hypothetical protein
MALVPLLSAFINAECMISSDENVFLPKPLGCKRSVFGVLQMQMECSLGVASWLLCSSDVKNMINVGLDLDAPDREN